MKQGLPVLGMLLILSGCDINSSQKNHTPNDPPEPQIIEDSVTHQLTMSWSTPTQKENNETLKQSELEAYLIYWGQQPDQLIHQIEVPATDNTYTINNLKAGNYFFSITARDRFGNESALSNVISKTLP